MTTGYRWPSRLRAADRLRAVRGWPDELGPGRPGDSPASRNFAVGIVVAHNFGLEEFGAFTLAWFTYGLILNISRGLATDPLGRPLQRRPGARCGEPRCPAPPPPPSSSASPWVWSASSSGSLCPARSEAPSSGSAVVLPLLLLQDSWRFAFFAAGAGPQGLPERPRVGPRPRPDAGRGSAACRACSASSSRGVSRAAWRRCSGCWQARVVPSLVGTPDLVPTSRGTWACGTLVENVTQSGGTQLRMYALGAIAGLAEVGGAARCAAPPRAAAHRAHGHRHGRRPGGGAVVAPLTAPPPPVLPRARLGGGLRGDALGHWPCGSSFPRVSAHSCSDQVWEPASVLVLPLCLSVVVSSFTTGATTGLRALGAARRSLRSQLVESTMFVLATVIGATVAGSPRGHLGRAGSPPSSPGCSGGPSSAGRSRAAEGTVTRLPGCGGRGRRSRRGELAASVTCSVTATEASTGSEEMLPASCPNGPEQLPACAAAPRCTGPRRSVARSTAPSPPGSPGFPGSRRRTSRVRCRRCANHRLFWKKVIWVGTSAPSALSLGPPYWLKMPLAPHAGHACARAPEDVGRVEVDPVPGDGHVLRLPTCTRPSSSAAGTP